MCELLVLHFIGSIRAIDTAAMEIKQQNNSDSVFVPAYILKRHVSERQSGTLFISIGNPINQMSDAYLGLGNSRLRYTKHAETLAKSSSSSWGMFPGQMGVCNLSNAFWTCLGVSSQKTSTRQPGGININKRQRFCFAWAK